ncbi:MAG: homocysteine S-methyltransferase family protein [Clostridiales bacterium]|nr:homocysteine S-methyltransferase family protein [Clostridiales bacterium]
MEIKFFDGSMGTRLQAMGLKPGELPEQLNITNEELVYSVHRSYVDAGAQFITTNTFGANSLKSDNWREMVRRGVQIARRTGKKVALDIGPTGKLLKPMGNLDFEDAVSIFAGVVNAGKDGSDLILIETMGDTYEMKAAVLAAKENCDLPVFVTMIFDEKGRLLTGADIKTAVAMLEGLGVDAVGFNCGLGPKQMVKHVKELVKFTELPIIIQPNAGLPESVNGNTVYNVSPAEFAQDMLEIAKSGVSYLGGCCGTTPEHIKEMISLCSPVKAHVPEKKNFSIVTSYSEAVEIGSRVLIIGERINPTGKKLLKDALVRQDMEYIIKEGADQKDCGADILDVNVGLPEIDEAETLKKAVFSLQSVLSTPLQIDTSDINALGAALRIYNGKPMLNSVNGKEENMKSVFPLAKKYGAVTVCLCLDENGIPKTAERRIEIAKKIIKTAAKYGIEKKDLIFDTLTMTISTDKMNAVETLKALEYLHNELGVNTVLGVSNVSFGLPKRDSINTAFFTLAMHSGLSAGIINPKSKLMMNAFYSFNALMGRDSSCTEYINSVTETAADTASAAQEIDLKSAIIKGMKEEAAKSAERLLKSEEVLDIINNNIVPALDTVGAGFEVGKVFLPQLLMSADAAKAAFDVVKKSLALAGKAEKSEDKIVIATVHGDIHDIGKNIVKALLANYGFDVIDLGKDVPEEDVVKAVKENNVKLVGLSALMTTTVPAMEKTIYLLHRETDAKVFVGGAVLTKKYADMIHADWYTKDAMESVRVAKAFFKKEKDK